MNRKCSDAPDDSLENTSRGSRGDVSQEAADIVPLKFLAHFLEDVSVSSFRSLRSSLVCEARVVPHTGLAIRHHLVPEDSEYEDLWHAAPQVSVFVLV